MFGVMLCLLMSYITRSDTLFCKPPVRHGRRPAAVRRAGVQAIRYFGERKSAAPFAVVARPAKGATTAC